MLEFATINPTIYNLICWFGGLLGQMTRGQASNVPANYIVDCQILYGKVQKADLTCDVIRKVAPLVLSKL